MGYQKLRLYGQIIKLRNRTYLFAAPADPFDEEGTLETEDSQEYEDMVDIFSNIDLAEQETGMFYMNSYSNDFDEEFIADELDSNGVDIDFNNTAFSDAVDGFIQTCLS